MTTEDIEEELLVGAHVGGLDAEEVVEGAGDVITLGNFGEGFDHFSESIGAVVVDLTQFDTTEDGEATVDLVGIDDGGVLADEATTLEPTHALVRGRSRKMYLGSQFLVGETGILLQGA